MNKATTDLKAIVISVKEKGARLNANMQRTVNSRPI